MVIDVKFWFRLWFSICCFDQVCLLFFEYRVSLTKAVFVHFQYGLQTDVEGQG